MVEVKIDRTTQHIQTYPQSLGDGLNITMVLIPPGEFMMGSPPTEAGHSSSEAPQHLVKISQPFFMGQTPITQAQWKIVAEKMPRVHRDLKPAPSRFKGKNLPVEKVSWRDAQEFCDRLSAHTNRRYRLPSEAEWEYACRAGTTEPFYFGATIDPQVANYRAEDLKIGDTIYPGKYGPGKLGKFPGETTPVGHYGAANNFGLCDMHGNVWEWCEDDWHDSYNGAPTDGSAWLTNSSLKILRGGSWIYDPNRCRSAYRFRYGIGNHCNDCGFRVMYAPARTF